MFRHLIMATIVVAAAGMVTSTTPALASDGMATVRVSYTSRANGIFPVRVVSINGEESGMARQREVIEIPAGEQTLTVQALIDQRWVGGTTRRIDFDSDHSVTHDFQAGTTYFVAAELPRQGDKINIIVGEWGSLAGQ